jgi:glucose-6-phosphate 1-dehydrogenase
LRERSNVLRFDLAKEELNLDLVNIKDDRGLKWQSMGLDARMSPQPLPSYGRLFLEVMSGNSLLFMRDDEVEEMWRIIQPIVPMRGKKMWFHCRFTGQVPMGRFLKKEH